CVQDVHRRCALPENDSGCAPTARLSVESSDIYSRSTPPSNFEIGSLCHRGLPSEEFLDMCDYSLHSVRTRPAKVGEKLVTHDFGTGTRGFAAPEDCSVAVCILPGTELAFERLVKYYATLMLPADTGHTVAIFRQINKGALHTNHDALEFPDGKIVLLTR